MSEFTDLDMHYILNDNREPVRCDFVTWMYWFEEAKNRVMAHHVTPEGRHISTIFLGINMAPLGHREPMFETMVLPDMERFKDHTFREAMATHDRLLIEYTDKPLPSPEELSLSGTGLELYRIAQDVTDQLFGKGAYAELNGFDPTKGEMTRPRGWTTECLSLLTQVQNLTPAQAEHVAHCGYCAKVIDRIVQRGEPS